MSEKAKNLAVVLLLFVFLAGFGLWTALRQPDAVSASERRKLAQRPELSADAVLDGSFMSDFESFSLDQFPLRERWRTLKALTGRYVLRQKDSNGGSFADGYAAKLDRPLNRESVAYAAGRFRQLYDTMIAGSGASVYLAVIPDKNYFLAEANGYPSPDYGALVDELRAQTEYMRYIDLFDQLELSDYYRTDSHWRQEALADAAAYLAREMGVTLTGGYEEKTLDRPYYGVYCGYAALPMRPDELRYLTNDTLEGCVVYNYETGGAGGVYDFDKAAGNDPYELFLSGPVSLLTIENPNAETDRELLILRDSFASSLAPLLAEGYAKITLADIRYLPVSQLAQLLDFTAQDVLFLYSASVLNNSETLK